MEWWQILLIILGALILLFVLSIIFYKQFFKRFWDIVLSGIAIIVFSPLILLFIIIGILSMKGNPFFTQLRPGKKDKNGKEKIFKLIKFRTMTNEKDEQGNLLPDEKRLNGYGKFLRSTSIDELPELFNIFIGNMSIIGPRPQLVKDMVFMSDEQRKRHDVIPGLSGLAQVSGRNSIDWNKKLELDLEYIKHITFFGDIALIFKTFFSVLKKEGITEEGEATASDYGDYLLKKNLVTKEEYDEKMSIAKKMCEDIRK